MNFTRKPAIWPAVVGGTLLGLIAAVSPAQDASGLIRVAVIGLHGDRGQVLCDLFSSPDAFPRKPDAAIRRAHARIENEQASCAFDGVAAGRYAIAVTHDANSNGMLDRNLLGMPAEGVGASNDARGMMGPPKFDSAAITFDGSVLDLTIRMRYL